ncbi:MAG: toxin HicA [Armatimonadota bacterium]
MGRLDKRREQMERNPRHVRFEDLDALLRSHGFERRQRSRGSSHYVYRRGRWHLTAPVHRPHLRLYVVLEALAALREIEAEEAEE